MATFANIFNPRPLTQPLSGNFVDRSLDLIVQAVSYQVPASERQLFIETHTKYKKVDQLPDDQKAALKAMLNQLPKFSRGMLEARLETTLSALGM